MAGAAVQSTQVEPQVGRAARTTAVHGAAALDARVMGSGAVFIFALSSIGLAYSGLLPFSTWAGVWPGSSLVGMIAVMLLISLVHAYTYAVIGTLAPRYGADYLVASRVVSGPLAFASSWTLVIFLALAGGFFVAYLVQAIVPMFARILSILSANPALLDSLAQISTPSAVVSIGTVGVTLLFLLLVLPPRVTKRLLLVGVLMTLLAWAVICFQAAFASNTDFPKTWEQFMGGFTNGSYQTHLEMARSLGMTAIPSTNALLFGGLMMGFWLFYGSLQPVLFASEVKHPQRNLLIGGWLSLVASGALVILVIWLVQRFVPGEWLSAESFLSQSSRFKDLTMPWLPFYAALLRPNVALAWLVGAAWLLAILNMAHTLLYTSSRVILAWASDRLFPASASYIHPVLRTPLIAVLFVSIVAEAGLVAAALGFRIDTTVNPVFFLACAQILPVLGVTLLPFVRPNWFRDAPAFARRKIGPIPLISLAGFLSLAYLAAILAGMFLYPAAGAVTVETLVLFVICFALGLAWYLIRRAYMKKQGDPIDEDLHRLPLMED